MRRSVNLLVSLVSVFALVGVVPATALAAERVEVSPFWPWDGYEVDVSGGDSAFVGYVWAAKTEGQLNAYIKGHTMSLKLADADTGEVVWEQSAEQGRHLWSDYYESPVESWYLQCKKENFWESAWVSDLPLEADRVYELTVEWSITHPLNDGFHMCDGLDHVNFPRFTQKIVSVITTD